ncbi:MAG: ribose 5-phosphate isomerase A [Candidatus Mycalebacterium zealandia]|nr:MAG: ribose 5-phosphate isomerase A [Candidatus Mycalebacterium zealandia]
MGIHKKKHPVRSFNEKVVRKASSMAVDFVSSGMVVGLGTGKAATFAVEYLAEKVQSGVIGKIVCVPSSIQTAAYAKSLGLTIDNKFKRDSAIDVTIDGADEVDRDFNVIKGGGGAMFREKIVAQESSRNIIVIDKSKLSERIGMICHVPVEVIPFAVGPVCRFISTLGATLMELRKDENGKTFKTDEKNYILDCDFGPIYDPKIIAESLVWRAGIVEHGLFLTTTTDILVSSDEDVEHLRVE